MGLNKEIIYIGDISTSDLVQNVVLPIGPRNIGKTVLLNRLLYYIDNNKNNFYFKLNSNFRNDKYYQNTISNFLTDYYFNSLPPRTRAWDFMIVDVFKDNELFFQLLERNFDFLGHDIKEPDNYFSQIVENSNLNKLYIFFFEDYNNMVDTATYYQYLENLIEKINKNDYVLLLFNKYDLHTELVENLSSNDFYSCFKNNKYNDRIIKKLEKFNISYDFMIFSSGVREYTTNISNAKWINGDNKYPDSLLNKIEKAFQK